MEKKIITGDEPVSPHGGFEERGLTIRQHFAAMVMQGLCPLNTTGLVKKKLIGLNDVTIAKKAVQLADALISELNK